MSISKTVVTCAEILLERTMCSAVFLRIGLMGTTSTRAAADAAEGEADGAAEAATGDAGRAGAGADGPAEAGEDAGGVGGGLGGAAGADAGVSGRPSMCVRMSCLVTRPAMPVPGMSRMSRLCSAAI